MLVTPACDWFKKEKTADVVVVEQPTLYVVDVNPADVFADAHIPGAVNLTLEGLEAGTKEWNKKSPVVVYCSGYTCTASHAAAKKLKELGFEDVAIYPGGIAEWHQLSKENKELFQVEGGAKLPFLQKVVEKVLPKEDAGKTISAEELAQNLAAKKN